MKRKVLALLLALALTCSLIPAALAAPETVATATAAATTTTEVTSTAAPETTAAEAAETADVFVTISDEGKLVVVREALSVTDLDEDGALTINDALIAVHDAKYEGGAKAGYASAETQWGLSIAKLWGVENGGSYGYYVNNAMAMGLADPIKTGDSLYAYSFADAEGFSDAFSYFSESAVEVALDSDVSLTLYTVSFDENFAPVSAPLAGAAIVINGEERRITTEEDGTVALTFPEAGTYVISAVAEGKTLVPPVCVITATEAKPADKPLFNDVKDSDWFAPAVKTAVDEGLMVGKGEGRFDPEANMTVAEYLTILYRMGEKAGLYEGKATTGAQWQEGAKAVVEALSLTFEDLDAPILRSGMAVATAAYLKAVAGDKTYVTRELAAFTDTEGNDAAEAIAFMASVGAINGYPDGTFLPNNTIRRCEVAQVLANMRENVKLADAPAAD